MANSMWGNNKINDKCRLKITLASTHWAYGVKIVSLNQSIYLTCKLRHIRVLVKRYTCETVKNTIILSI